tara:strand:- start:988 stop:1185 length:198 start_codon:yes stop_codon:yes gene_type:complete
MNREQVITDSIPVTNTMKRLKIETPLGSIESDSGNHGLDILTIIGVIAVLYVGKKLVDKFFRRDK